MQVTTEKETYCHTCSRWFHYLGIANHRKAHLVRGEQCRITYTNGDTYVHGEPTNSQQEKA